METKSYTKAELRKLMESTGYSMASIEKTLRLLELLKAINADEFLSANLTLKGGTAINIIHYSEIPRLSVDLDFDLARNTLKEEMLQVKDEVSARIREMSASMGYFMSDPRPNYAIHQTELYYRSTTGNQDKIKLDINCLSRCHMYESVVRNARNPFLPDDESVTIIRKCIAYYLSLSRGVDIEQSLDAIRKRPIQDFKKQLFPMLKTGYGFVDRDLMTSEALKCVSRFLSFTENEIAYLEAAKSDEYRPDLLFEGTLAERIAENPAAKIYITKDN